jgi:hypothetical protein
MDHRPGGEARPRGHHLDPKYASLLAPAITAVAIPTAIVVAPRAQRLVGRLTGATLQRRGYGGSARSRDPNHQAREAD